MDIHDLIFNFIHLKMPMHFVCLHIVLILFQQCFIGLWFLQYEVRLDAQDEIFYLFYVANCLFGSLEPVHVWVVILDGFVLEVDTLQLTHLVEYIPGDLSGHDALAVGHRL